MPSKQYEQHDFSVGELSPDHVWRTDIQVRNRSLRSAENMRLLVGGPAQSRPGSTRLAQTANGDGQVVDVSIAGTVYMLVFTGTHLEVWAKATRTLITTLTGLAWSAPQAPLLTISPEGAKTFVFYETMHPQVIERSMAGVWTVTPYAFESGIGSATAQPYYRFAAPGVTLTPSAGAGTITLLASAAYFSASHVGLRLRLQNREVVITVFTDTTHVTATVTQQLFPTMTVTLTSSVGYELGEIVEGKDSTAKGEVTAIPDGTHITVLMQTFTNFYYVGSTGEVIIGRNATATSTAAPSATTDAAVLDWTEQAMSDFRGWPGAGAVHRGRLFMARFAQIPFGIVASAVGDFYDCEVGANDADAIFEELGDEGTGIIQHIVSAEQLIVLTSRQSFYYPESESNPIKPTGFQLLRIGPDGASDCRPVLISEGVLFGEAGGGSIRGCFPTGDVRHSWRTADLSRLAQHLIGMPRTIAYVSGSPVDPLRYAYAVNTDGTLAVVSYSESESDAVPGWTPWTTQGVFRWLAADQGECWAIVARSYPGVAATHYTLEVFETSRLVDCANDVLIGALQGPATGQVIVTPAGNQTADFVYRCAAMAGATCSLVIGGDYIGEVVVNSSGDFGVPDLAGAIQLGFGFSAECVPWPPMDAEDQRSRRRKRRISRALVRYQGKGLAVNGKLRPTFDAGEDTSQPGPLRDELWPTTCFGWSQEPTVTVAKPYAAPWTVLGLSLEVTS